MMDHKYWPNLRSGREVTAIVILYKIVYSLDSVSMPTPTSLAEGYLLISVYNPSVEIMCESFLPIATNLMTGQIAAN